MIIRKFAFGNRDEAFIEKGFGKQVNIIFSDDNNKGKTLVLQGIMFALGNEPIFPAGFNNADYYFYLEFEVNGKSFKVLRKSATFTVFFDEQINIFESVSEFKYFFDQHIFKLPGIIHKGFYKLVDLSLFLQLFFVGQDKRNTSNIFNGGFYNKSDFIEMLYALQGLSGTELTNEELKQLQDELKQLRRAESKLAQEIDRFNINKAVLENVKSSASYSAFQEQDARLKKLNDRLVELRKQKYSETSRLNHQLNLKAELNSLNRTIALGAVSCDDCGSENITYKSKDITFDITNKEVRKSILSSLDNKIKTKREVIIRIDYEISEVLKQFDSERSQVSPKLRDIILFQDELNKTGSLDKERQEKQRKIEILTQKVKEASTKQQGLSNKQIELINTVVTIMNEVYKLVDESGVQVFTDLFTKRSVNYSGSEEQEFYFAKMYALSVVFKHPFPIVIDSFRDRELSSSKEIRMIEIFEVMDKQVIITATLKKEEYSIDKYKTGGAITAIDYSSHGDSKILSTDQVDDFKLLFKQFGVNSI